MRAFDIVSGKALACVIEAGQESIEYSPSVPQRSATAAVVSPWHKSIAEGVGRYQILDRTVLALIFS